MRHREYAVGAGGHSRRLPFQLLVAQVEGLAYPTVGQTGRGGEPEQREAPRHRRRHRRQRARARRRGQQGGRGEKGPRPDRPGERDLR